MEDKDIKITLEQYKLMFSSTETLFKERTMITNYFLIAYSGFIGFYMNFLYKKNVTCNIRVVFLLFLVIITIYLVNVLKNYKKTIKAKFQVLEELEKKLPEQIFTNEYTFAKENGKIDLSTLEQSIAWVLLIFGILIVLLLPQN